jgi:tungstate transport system ATP-binding protein
MSPIYQLTDVTKVYNGRRVLNIERLEVFAGEILGLIGPSGAGKSTLLRLLDFLEPPTTGTIGFRPGNQERGSGGDQERGRPGDKERLSNEPLPLSPSPCLPFSPFPPPLAVRRRVTTVFQRPVLLNRSVTDNVAYGLRIRGQYGRFAYGRFANRPYRFSVQAVLERVGLADLARAPASTLSGGEVQRVALARALVIEPEVLLLDEPTANLDPANVKLIETVIRDLNAQQGTTIVLVTHNVFQARRLAHRVAFLLDGELVEVGPTAQIFESPADARTAAFVGGDMVC